MNYIDIIESIKNKSQLYPIYFLTGEEPYFINKIVDNLTSNILTEEEKEFNQTILYGQETNINEVINQAKQYPFGCERRLIIVKEAQHIKKIEDLEKYLENPQKHTILVICYNNKSIDKRKKIVKIIKEKFCFFESKKIYLEKIPNWIINNLKEKNYQIDQKAAYLLSNHIGNDLTKINNEINKLTLSIKNNTIINTEIIEKYVGISKDYNIFEFQDSIAKKNIFKAYNILAYFSKNTKTHNIIPIINNLFLFFQKIIILNSLKDKSNASISSNLKINPYFISQYKLTAKNYSPTQVIIILQHLKEYDLKSKGVNNNSTNQTELLKELTYKILHS